MIGTHQLVNKKILFKDLGLLIVDEEQKFGVAVKEKIRSIKDLEEDELKNSNCFPFNKGKINRK